MFTELELMLGKCWLFCDSSFSFHLPQAQASVPPAPRRRGWNASHRGQGPWLSRTACLTKAGWLGLDFCLGHPRLPNAWNTRMP